MLKATFLIKLSCLESWAWPDSFDPFNRLCNAHNVHIVDCLGEVLRQTFLISSGTHVIYLPFLNFLEYSDFVCQTSHVRIYLPLNEI